MLSKNIFKLNPTPPQEGNLQDSKFTICASRDTRDVRDIHVISSSKLTRSLLHHWINVEKGINIV
jgi:hypothetical protein